MNRPVLGRVRRSVFVCSKVASGQNRVTSSVNSKDITITESRYLFLNLVIIWKPSFAAAPTLFAAIIGTVSVHKYHCQYLTMLRTFSPPSFEKALYIL